MVPMRGWSGQKMFRRSLVLSKWLNCSEEMQARHWLDKLRVPQLNLHGRPRSPESDDR